MTVTTFGPGVCYDVPQVSLFVEDAIRFDSVLVTERRRFSTDLFFSPKLPRLLTVPRRLRAVDPHIVTTRRTARLLQGGTFREGFYQVHGLRPR